MDLSRPLRALLALAAPASLLAGAQGLLGRSLPSPSPWTAWMPEWLGAVALGAAAAVLLQGGRRPWLAWVMGIVALPVAARLILVAHAWGAAGWAAPAVGAVVGFFVLAGAWAVERRDDVPPEVQGEWAALLEQARRAREALQQELDARPSSDPDRAALEERASRLLQGVGEAARAWSRLEHGAGDAALVDVERRLAAVRDQADAAADPLVKAEHTRTVDALERQRESLQRIRRGHERALARARHQVTVMDTARLGVMAHAAQDRHAQGDESARLAALLDAASQDLETAAGALEEAEAETLKLTSP